MFQTIRITTLGILIVCFTGTEIFADGGTATREQAEAFFAMHAGRWSGKVESTIGEAEISKVDSESLNYLDFTYLQSNGLLKMRNYGPRSGGLGFSHYDSHKKIIRSINHGVDGVVTYHEIFPEHGKWIRNSKQVSPDGMVREFNSTIAFLDNNKTIKIDIDRTEGGKIVSSQTNIWRRIK